MKYQIFRMEQTSRLEPDGYNIKTVTSYTLGQDEYPEDFESIEKAEKHIYGNINDFKDSKAIILPVYEINYYGDIN